MKQNGFRLLTLLTVTELLLAAGGLLAAGMLIISTGRLHDLAKNISAAVESVYQTEQAERALLVHSARSNLYEITGSPEYRQQRDLAREHFASWMKALGAHISSENEREMLKLAEANADRYFQRREELAAQNTSAEAIMTSLAGVLEEAQSSLGMLVQINYEQARGFQDRVQLENALANRVGFGAAALVAVILAAAFLLLDRSLRRPVIYLTKAARSLNAGKLLLIEPRGPAELREIAGVFNGLVARVQQQRDSQLRFLAGIAHDLRTPLHAIGLSAECMEGENLDADQRETLRAVKGQVEQLDHQVSDLLDTTRIESGQLALRPSRQNVIQLVENTVKLFGGTSERHNVTLHAPAQPLVCVCDPTRITQVLNNLISNAIKYSPVGGDVVTSVTEDECHINIEVRDEGMGISPEDLPHIFEPFRRTASTRETIPGVGLGLSVAKRLVEAHGGTIEVASTRGTGTTFTVRLPRAPAETGKKVNGEK